MPRMLRDRLLVGPLLIVGLLGLLWLDQSLGAVPVPPIMLPGQYYLPIADLLGWPQLPPGLVILLGLLVLVGAAAFELAGMIQAKGLPAQPGVLWFAAAIGLLTMYFSGGYGAVQPQLAWFATWLIVVLLVALRGQTLGGKVDGALPAAGAALLAMIYLGLVPGFFLAIRQGHSAWVLAAVVLVTKSCDIGAYFAGKTIGRHKLIPWLSPGKTVEGLFGGMILAGFVAAGILALSRLIGPPEAIDPVGQIGLTALGAMVPLPVAFFGGAILGIVGQVGDLLVSLMKRDAGVKDSGQTLPGFGGLLDIMDSPLLVAPVAFWLLTALG
jgi:phosphatidate cytidylyltransferase